MQELGEGGGVGPVQPWRIRRANADCTIFGFPLYRFPFCLFYNSVVGTYIGLELIFEPSENTWEKLPQIIYICIKILNYANLNRNNKIMSQQAKLLYNRLEKCQQ